MLRMIDIHSHILPGVDDGARNMEHARKILDIAYEEGIRGMIATPHYELGRNNTDVSDLYKLLEEVKKILPEDFLIYLGHELLYYPGIIDALKLGTALTLNNTRYILVEYFPDTDFTEIYGSIRIFLMEGYIPIIAHSERYLCLLKKPDQVGELVEAGAYIQINISSISSILHTLGRHCRKLLDRNWIHFLGTDTHGTKYRPPYVSKTLRSLEKDYGEAMINKLVWDNPARMLEDKLIHE